MTDHPLTDDDAADLWDEHYTPAHPILRWELAHEIERTATLALLRTTFDKGREYEREHTTPLDPLADLTPGTMIRDAVINGYGAIGDAFIMADVVGPYIATAHCFYSLPFLTAFTTDDRTIRYTRHGNAWTAENLNGETND